MFWNSQSKSFYFRILMIGGISQILLMMLVFRNPSKPQETTFHEMDSSNNYMNVCALPVYDYWHPTVMRHVDYDFDPTRDCDENFRPYTELVNGTWRIVEERQGTNCSARCYEWAGEYNVRRGPWMQPGVVSCEFLEAVCWEGEHEVYGYMHTQIVKKEPTTAPKFANPPNVFVFLFDSLSTGQAKRSFPKSISTLSSRFESVEFPFVNKVGENSRPNGIPLWFGKSIEPINNEAFGGENIEPDWNYTKSCYTDLEESGTSIFKDFESHGYMTMDIDDWASQMVNYPSCNGFREPPTHHYMHPFQLVYERFGANITKEHLNGKLCREEVHPVLEYFQQFVDAYKGRPMFTWMWLNTFGHSMFNGLMRADDILVKVIERNAELFENSFVFLMGDHGYRIGKKRFLQTDIGTVEMHNPYLSISIPKRLRGNQAILETMRQNSRKLQTHYDTRATLLDILKFQPQSSFSDKSILEISGEKGNSYFRRQPSFPRTCGRLPIPPEYCICQVEKVPVEDENLKERFGRQLIDYIHDQLEKGNFSSMCEKFEMRKVTSLVHFGHTNHSNTFHNYEIVVETAAPSFAQFQTILMHEKKTNEVKFVNIIRLDRIGKTGECTDSSFHEKLCFCKSLALMEKWKYRMEKQMAEMVLTIEGYFPKYLIY
ncbi:unnamed protein product [Caenorhabditis sp. 36 PRJEB53466]|nr:unnamed protein product [Caenorhabditis sp. 36 PRJEB53466]